MGETWAEKYLAAVREFAETAMEYGRDAYGPKHTPLFIDGLNVETREPVMWKSPDGEEWVLVNVASQQNFYRTLTGLSALTGDPRYKAAALDALRYAYANLKHGGYLSWGGHMAYDASTDTLVFADDKDRCNELKSHYPFWELMWEADPGEAKALIETIWNGQVIDWSNLDFTRHGFPKEMGKLWDNEYVGGDVFFWGEGLTFLNSGSDMYYAAALLSKLAADPRPLVWAKRMAHRYVETRNPKTGIGGFQFSQMATAWCTWDGNQALIRGDRAEYQYGECFPGHLVVEGTLFPCYGGTPGVQPLVCQMTLGEALGESGKDFTRWAVAELTAWGRSAYRAEDNSFIPMLTDGTIMEGFVVRKDGYFGPKGRVLRAGKAGADHFWAYAMAFRATGDAFMWEMARSIARATELGDIGATPHDKPKVNLDSDAAEPTALLGFLELHRAVADEAFLAMAQRIGDNILARRFHKGMFAPSVDHIHAKFDRVEPLALLHLVAATQGRAGLVPEYPGGYGFYAAAYGTEGHRYDNRFIYERRREGT
ncbi:MAG: pectate lyase [Armatimonadetes bacterium]|nr:pectate lyase [Armatimonadota bacterium]